MAVNLEADVAVRRLILGLTLSLIAIAQEDDARWSVDFLVGYYDQTGDHSAVTGGVGTEDLQSASPIVDIKFNPDSAWSHSAHLGFDNVTSASIDAMDHVSGASRVDTRAFLDVTSVRDLGKSRISGILGFSTEYDYFSAHGGLSYAMDFNQKNTTAIVGLTHYADTVDLYDIEGVNQGDTNRDTTDLTFALTQVLGRKTVVTGEFFISDQSGFLSSPFQEVEFQDGTITAERLPDARTRTALTLKLNHAYSDRFIVRHSLRHYDDDFDIQAETIELEPYIKIGSKQGSWFSLTLRYHIQDGSPYFFLPSEANLDDDFYTADRDLSTFDSYRVSIAYKAPSNHRYMDRYKVRLSYYKRDEGLNSMTLSLGFGWSRQ